MQIPIRVLALAALALPVRAADFSSSGRGTTSAQFLKLGVSARAMAMGEAYSAVADEASALYWNPAALTQIPNASLTLMHVAYAGSSSYDYAAYAKNLGSWGAVAVGGQFFSMGTVAQTDALGNDLGNLSPRDTAISLGYAHALPGDAALGVCVKHIRSTVLTTAQTQAADIGLLSPDFWRERLRLALVASNLGRGLKFEREEAGLPLTLKAGSRLRVSRDLISSLDAIFPNDSAAYAAWGMEYRAEGGQNISGLLRFGINTRNFRSLGAMGAVSAGAGLALKNLSVDYAILPMGALGLTHRFSLSLRWNAPPPERQTREISLMNWVVAP